MRTFTIGMLLLFSLNLCTVEAISNKQVNSEDLKEVLLTQFHHEISESIKTSYKVQIPQYEKENIISIKKNVVPEPSEEMKPGTTYEIEISVEVLTNTEERELFTLLLSNDNIQGEFKVIDTDRKKLGGR
ncbi:hypothetical protein SM124_03235 (plasmid) [Bacillus sp. 31A1R]|uniref:DUF3888 domain-containing protein n=1 Tax=Robertmurraya mangrovi TaxID=3098077 RepID=A0ABU5IUE8_9BACI|nr:hypothetical protein [Bacillus sp. 31A1R]MDZ5470759.1 hypothetical protein [Bacillus sp. 31A1R]